MKLAASNNIIITEKFFGELPSGSAWLSYTNLLVAYSMLPIIWGAPYWIDIPSIQLNFKIEGYVLVLRWQSPNFYLVGWNWRWSWRVEIGYPFYYYQKNFYPHLHYCLKIFVVTKKDINAGKLFHFWEIFSDLCIKKKKFISSLLYYTISILI